MAIDDRSGGRKPPFSRRAVLGWLLYDWANSAFALSVMTAFFPVFFKKFWCAGWPASYSTIRLNLGNACVGLCIVLLAPVLGALADAGRCRKRFLTGFMLCGIIGSAALAVVPGGQWRLALAVFIVANIGFSCANIFYDALLPCVAAPERMDIVSSVGFALGYVGCAVLYVVNLVMVRMPEAFGLADTVAAVRASFLTVSVWWAVFAVPILLWVKEPGGGSAGTSMLTVIARGLRQLADTARDIVSRRILWLFLLAYWLYIDGVDTFIRAAADLGLSIGLDENGLLLSLLVVQVVAFPFAYVFGLLAGRVGTQRALLVGIGLYLFVTLVGPLTVRTTLQFGVFAAISAMPLGALQALSRSYWARMVPADKAAEYFGFYSLMGKFSVVVGPAMVAGVTALVRALGGSSSSAARYGCASLSVFFVAGAVLLALVGREERKAVGQRNRMGMDGVLSTDNLGTIGEGLEL